MGTNQTFEQSAPTTPLILTDEARGYLKAAGSWANFLGILSIIIGTFFLLTAVFANVLLPALPGAFPGYKDMPAGVVAIVCVAVVLFDILYFFFAVHLFQFGRRAKKGILFNDSAHVTQAMARLKSFFKLWGIVTIVILCLFGLEVLFLVIENVGVAAMQHK